MLHVRDDVTLPWVDFPTQYFMFFPVYFLRSEEREGQNQPHRYIYIHIYIYTYIYVSQL